jgi:indolepyruvate ferredoxin oxidoreductase
VDDARVSLAERFDATTGTLYVTGTQALVLLPLLQARIDARRGVATAGYITGYRGSPLGGYDLQLERERSRLDAAGIVFQPGLNEDLAATAVWGTQQVALRGEGRVAGVFSIWYGKGPGVDRSGDALRHGNLAGSSRDGGVLVLTGDDHTCESSTTAHQSEYALVDAMIPVLNPAGLQELVEFGLLGWEMSRQSGCWIGVKCVKDTIDVTGTVMLPERLMDGLVAESVIPRTEGAGLNIRLGDTPLEQEERLHRRKLVAAQAFARTHAIDCIVSKPAAARVGIVSAGKSYLDTLAALDALGLRAGGVFRDDLAVLKLGLTWPIDPEIVKRFADGLDCILVIEEKRPLIEAQVKDLLFNERNGIRVIGKRDLAGAELLPSHGSLSRSHIHRALSASGLLPDALRGDTASAESVRKASGIAVIDRKPYFCAGCPHSTSTVVPEGSRAYAGIGCSYMAQWMDRETQGFTQMGGEGANWIGEAPFSNRDHVFQNMGDGTYLHSGLLAIRAAVAAKTHMTFKILFNDAVAMTGGQVHDGVVTPGSIATQLLAEGVSRVVVTSDDRARTLASSRIPAGVEVIERDGLLDVQRELRDAPGVTALIHDQMCAAEKRRRRKRGSMPNPSQRVFINTAVCEGCGDCGTVSNCVAVKPVETAYGTKRVIDQGSCNADFSCLKGFCPSFVTVTARSTPTEATAPEQHSWRHKAIPEPAFAALPCSILVTGVGGTGVVTVSAIVAMAAYQQGLHFTSLDMAGLAQKGGEVAAHIRICGTAEELSSPRIDVNEADTMIVGDLVVGASAKMLEKIRPGGTRLAVNEAEIPTGDFVRDVDLRFPKLALKQRLLTVSGAGECDFLDATALAEKYLGDGLATNMVLLGYAYQRGMLPVSSASIERAISENGTAIEFNLSAFQLGRLFAHQPQVLGNADSSRAEPALEENIANFSRDLESYQNPRLARQYRDFIAMVQTAERDRCGGGEVVTAVVALNLARLMRYKDEYEVARLLTAPSFGGELERTFGPGAKVTYHLAPPFLSFLKDGQGRPRKHAFGSWIAWPLRALSAMRHLRGTAFDPFGYGAERRREREAIAIYKRRTLELIAKLNSGNQCRVAEVLSYAGRIRGFGPVKLESFARSEVAFATAMAKLDADIAVTRDIVHGEASVT